MKSGRKYHSRFILLLWSVVGQRWVVDGNYLYYYCKPLLFHFYFAGAFAMDKPALKMETSLGKGSLARKKDLSWWLTLVIRVFGTEYFCLVTGRAIFPLSCVKHNTGTCSIVRGSLKSAQVQPLTGIEKETTAGGWTFTGHSTRPSLSNSGFSRE